MGLKCLSVRRVHHLKVAELGLNPYEFDLTSVEAISSALRRVSSIHCPCPGLLLVRSVVEPMRGLVGDLEEFKRVVEQTLEDMIAHGDILEHLQVDAHETGGKTQLLYTAPPSFVVRKSGMVMLLGVTKDQSSALPNYLHQRIEYRNHSRLLQPSPEEDLPAQLSEFGLHRVSIQHWQKAPKPESAAQYLSRIKGRLEAAQPSYDVPGLTLLDPESPVGHYANRWTSAKAQSGRFVARRSQAFGADLWSYVKLREGTAERLIDFPLEDSSWRGCDEAWRVQLAIDSLRGNPQRYRVDSATTTPILGFFSPIPMWARRRWDAIGEPVRSSQCLFAYRLPESELAEELTYARNVLWLDDLPARS